MSALKKYPLFVAALGVCGAIALGEGWFIYERWAASREAAAMLEKKRAELRTMGDLALAPTRANASAIEADLARAERARTAMQAELKGRGPAAERLRTAKVPAARTDAYFDLATFVEKMRELAKAQDVEVKPEAVRFGFSLYAHEGPKAERIAPVFHQRLIAQYIVESLLAAKPRALLTVKRESALTKTEKDKRDADAIALAGGTPPAPPDGAPIEPPEAELDQPDFFTIDPRASARVPGFVDTTAFQLVFVGQTAALRAFLNQLASFELPVLVREVEVEPASGADLTSETPPAPADDSATAGSAAPFQASVMLTAGAPTPTPAAKAVMPSVGRAPGVAPIVSKPWCKFTVTVEYIELVPAAGAVAEAAAAEPAKPTS